MTMREAAGHGAGAGDGSGWDTSDGEGEGMGEGAGISDGESEGWGLGSDEGDGEGSGAGVAIDDGAGAGLGAGAGYCDGDGEGDGEGSGWGDGSDAGAYQGGTTMAAKARAVLIGNGSYGLYIGETAATDEEILAAKAVRLANCRHVRYWYSKTGGITSLAAWGPWGEKQMKCRVGAPCPSALIVDVRTVFDLSDEAIQNFALIVAQ